MGFLDESIIFIKKVAKKLEEFEENQESHREEFREKRGLGSFNRLQKGYKCSVKQQIMVTEYMGAGHLKNKRFKARVRATETAIVVSVGGSQTHTFPYHQINDVYKRGSNLRLGTDYDTIQIKCRHAGEIVQAIEYKKSKIY